MRKRGRESSRNLKSNDEIIEKDHMSDTQSKRQRTSSSQENSQLPGSINYNSSSHLSNHNQPIRRQKKSKKKRSKKNSKNFKTSCIFIKLMLFKCTILFEMAIQ
jgi:hypothetical protein